MTYALFENCCQAGGFDVDRLADGKINREAAETKQIRDIKEQEVYFGEIPLMTENGTFIINERSGLLLINSTVRPASFLITIRVKSSPVAS